MYLKRNSTFFFILVLSIALLSCGGGESNQDTPEGIPVLDATGVEVGILPYTESLYMGLGFSGASILVSEASNPRATLAQGLLSVTVSIEGGDYMLYGNPDNVSMHDLSSSTPAAPKKTTAWILLLLLAVVWIGMFIALWFFANKITDTRTGGWKLEKFSIPVSPKDPSKILVLALSGPMTWGPATGNADALAQLLKSGFDTAAREAGDIFETWLLSVILDPAHQVFLENLEEKVVMFLANPAKFGWSNKSLESRQGLHVLYAGFKTLHLSQEASRIRSATADGVAAGLAYKGFRDSAGVSNGDDPTGGMAGAFAYFASRFQSNGSGAAEEKVPAAEEPKKESE